MATVALPTEKASAFLLPVLLGLAVVAFCQFKDGQVEELFFGIAGTGKALLRLEGDHRQRRGDIFLSFHICVVFFLFSIDVE